MVPCVLSSGNNIAKTFTYKSRRIVEEQEIEGGREEEKYLMSFLVDLSCLNGAWGVHYDCNSLLVNAAFDVAIPYIYAMHTKEAQTSLFSAI